MQFLLENVHYQMSSVHQIRIKALVAYESEKFHLAWITVDKC